MHELPLNFSVSVNTLILLLSLNHQIILRISIIINSPAASSMVYHLQTSLQRHWRHHFIICALFLLQQIRKYTLRVRCSPQKVLNLSWMLLQIPDTRTGDDIIDAVVVDEEAVATEGRVCGAKILYGRGAFDRYLLAQHKSKDVEVCSILLATLIFSTTSFQLIVQIPVWYKYISNLWCFQTNAEVVDGEADVEAEQELPSIVAL